MDAVVRGALVVTRKEHGGYAGYMDSYRFEVTKVDDIWMAETFQVGGNGRRRDRQWVDVGDSNRPEPDWEELHDILTVAEARTHCEHEWRAQGVWGYVQCARCNARVPGRVTARSRNRG